MSLNIKCIFGPSVRYQTPFSSRRLARRRNSVEAHRAAAHVNLFHWGVVAACKSRMDSITLPPPRVLRTRPIDRRYSDSLSWVHDGETRCGSLLFSCGASLAETRRNNFDRSEWERCERGAVKRFACSVTSLGEFDALLFVLLSVGSRRHSRLLALARSEETALGWRTRGREDRDTLCSLRRGIAAAWVINVTIQRSECGAVNGLRLTWGGCWILSYEIRGPVTLNSNTRSMTSRG